MLSTIAWCVLLPALAQEPATPPAADAPGAAPAVVEAVPAEPLVLAIDLPDVAVQLRSDGVSEPDVQGALRAARERHVSAADAHDALDAAHKAAREHGPVDNFGAFVQAQLDSGKRGQELADAIRAEHAAHGKGPRGDHGKDDNHGGERGPDGDHGRDDDHGKDAPRPEGGRPPEAGGKSGEHGRPEGAGKPEGDHGRPDGDRAPKRPDPANPPAGH